MRILGDTEVKSLAGSQCGMGEVPLGEGPGTGSRLDGCGGCVILCSFKIQLFILVMQFVLGKMKKT